MTSNGWSGREEWWKEGEGTRYFTPASLFLASSISPSLHLGTVDARSIITLPLSPPLPSSLLVLVANLSPSLHLLLLLLRHFSTPATFPSLVAPRYLVPRPVTRSWPSFNVPPLLRCVHSQLHTTRRRPEMQGHAALRFSRVKPSLIPGATLHTIRERHGVASPLWPTLPLVQHVVTTDVTSRAPRPRLLRRHENLRARTHRAISNRSIDRSSNQI